MYPQRSKWKGKIGTEHSQNEVRMFYIQENIKSNFVFSVILRAGTPV